MLKITRNKIKGSSLDKECKNARVCREEHNSNIYCFCYGLIDLHYDDYTDKCKNCKACVKNMPDWEESWRKVGKTMNEIFKLIAESGRTDLMEEWYKIEKKLEVFDVIKEKQVDVWLLQQCDYKNYIRIRKEAEIEDELTEEEFELVKEEIKDYGSKKEN